MELLPDGILHVVYAGHITTQIVAGSVQELREVLARGGVRAVVMDTDHVTSFDKDTGSVSGELLRTIRGGGVQVMLASIPSRAVRMMAISISFAAGIPFEVAPSWKEAHALATSALARRRT